MYSSSQYDGDDPFSGGTFSQSQPTQSASGDPASKSQKRGGTRLSAVTVKQISDALQKMPDDSSTILIDGCEINIVKLAGMVVNKLEKVTEVSFTLDDGTGRIDVTRWLNEISESNQMALVENGSYVIVIGHLKTYQGKTSVSSFSVRPITDFDELTFHYVECVDLHATNLKKQSQGTPLLSSSVSEKESPGKHHGLSQNSSGLTTSGSDQDINTRVQKIFEEPSSLAIEQGLHVDEVVRRLGLPKKRVLDAVDFLASEGYIYSTIDDDHYKSTSG